jgi:hypothetical protein
MKRCQTGPGLDTPAAVKNLKTQPDACLPDCAGQKPGGRLESLPHNSLGNPLALRITAFWNNRYQRLLYKDG